MPEQLAPQRLAAERAWIAAYPALITSGLLAKGLIALGSPLATGPQPGRGFSVLLPALLFVASVAYARGRAWAGVVLVCWAAITLLGHVLSLDLVTGAFDLVILVVLYRVRPIGGDAAVSARPLRWLVPAVLVGVIDTALPLTLGAVTRTRVVDVAPITSALSADLDLERAWSGGQVRLTPRGDRLVLEGVEIALGQEVAIVPGRRVMLIGDAVLRGHPVDEPAGGIAFVRRFGRIRGRVVVARTGSDDLHLSFEGLEVDCRRVRIGVALRRDPAALPGALERE